MRIETLIELAMKDGIELPYYSERDLRKNVYKNYYESLEDYLRGFSYTVGVMRTEEGIERVSYEFAKDSYDDGVLYFECRFAPQLLAGLKDLSSIEVVEAVNRGFKRATDEANENDREVREGVKPPYKYGVILCALRYFNEHMSPYYQAFTRLFGSEKNQKKIFGLASLAMVQDALLLRDEMEVPVVGVDIAGGEADFPAKSHIEAFTLAHKHLLGKTVHGGEGFGNIDHF